MDRKDYESWLETKAIIKKFLGELCSWMSEDALDHNASAIIARLAQKEFLIVRVEDLKEGS